MSKIFIIEDCTKCPNFIPCTDPRDFRVSCKKLGCLGSPLIFIGGGFPIDCPLNDYAEPKMGHWITLKDEYGDVVEAVCSNCHKNGNHKWSLCPYCGAIMVEQQESEDKK